PSAVALAVISHPELFAKESRYGDVETSGDLTRGTTLFDRRIRPDNQTNMQGINEIDVVATMDYILRGLAAAS
ncbi:MAG: nucleoside hydrolase, partial [Planctomycetota bacterium]|nr:nucleoside hydrolase [Planctomycetota bacterium]